MWSRLPLQTLNSQRLPKGWSPKAAAHVRCRAFRIRSGWFFSSTLLRHEPGHESAHCTQRSQSFLDRAAYFPLTRFQESHTCVAWRAEGGPRGTRGGVRHRRGSWWVNRLKGHGRRQVPKQRFCLHSRGVVLTPRGRQSLEPLPRSERAHVHSSRARQARSSLPQVVLCLFPVFGDVSQSRRVQRSE